MKQRPVLARCTEANLSGVSLGREISLHRLQYLPPIFVRFADELLDVLVRKLRDVAGVVIFDGTDGSLERHQTLGKLLKGLQDDSEDHSRFLHCAGQV